MSKLFCDNPPCRLTLQGGFLFSSSLRNSPDKLRDETFPPIRFTGRPVVFDPAAGVDELAIRRKGFACPYRLGCQSGQNVHFQVKTDRSQADALTLAGKPAKLIV
ncbi:MAG: hypothetical protein AB1Z51_05290 [Desulfuromonadales bacterium]